MEKAISGRVQTGLPSVFGEQLTAICGKSNKNGEQRFSLLIFFFLKDVCLRKVCVGAGRGRAMAPVKEMSLGETNTSSSSKDFLA